MLVFITSFTLGILATFVFGFFSKEENRELFMAKINDFLNIKRK